MGKSSFWSGWSTYQRLILVGIVVGEFFMVRLLIKQFLIHQSVGANLAEANLTAAVIGLATAIIWLPMPLVWHLRMSTSLRNALPAQDKEDPLPPAIRTKLDQMLFAAYFGIYAMAFGLTHLIRS